ncbi:MAG: aminotransferase class III-fold pyridoxal phosphate-dependent enzyme [Acidobacteriota bacterium]
MSQLPPGDALPEIVTPPPGPRARQLCRRLATYEAPGINTVGADGETILWEEARGSNVLDVDGNRYLDLTSGFGVAAVGHRHPKVEQALLNQSGKLIHGLGDVHAHRPRVRLAEALARRAPVHGDGEAAVHFAISGSDAVEIGLKTAYLATGRPGIIAFDPAYHGLTLGALVTTSRAAFREPFTPYLHSHVHRLPFAASPAEIARLLDRRPDIGSLLFEPIAGREGILLPPTGWIAEVVELCRQRDVLTIADEIFTGCGRTGRWFAVEHDDARPDLLVCGKALGGGLPMAAVVADRELLRVWSTPGEALQTATFVAHPLACAAALASLEVIEQEDLLGRAREIAAAIASREAEWQALGVVEVRGRGAVWGAEVESSEVAYGWAERARARGLLVLAGGANGRVVQVTPPLVITPRQLATALDLLTESLARAR